MALTDNDRLQELALVAGDKVSLVDRKWWIALVVTILAVIPGYYLLKSTFVTVAMGTYRAPAVIYNNVAKQALQITDKGIIDLGNNSYSAYIKIRNLEYDWGVPSQSYTAEFKTYGGTSITKVTASTFILPSSEKLVVLSRFSAPQKPDELIVTLDQTHFIHKPNVDFNYSLERVSVKNPSSGLSVSAGIKNLTPFTIKQINLPVAVYDNQGKVVAVNFTNVNDVLSGETRTFQYSETPAIAGGSTLRAEISPEINIFDRDVLQLAPGVSPFNTSQ